MLRLDQKKEIVKHLSVVANETFSFVAAEYSGLTSEDMTQLRVLARNGDIYLRVVRNTLVRKALASTPYQDFSAVLKGQVIIAASSKDPGAPARLFRDFAKTHERLVVRALSLGGTVMSPKDLNAVADLPTKDKAIAMLMSVMQAPITKFVRTLVAPHTKLVRTFAALRDQKQA